MSVMRSRWAAIGAAVAVSLGFGGVGLVDADLGSGDRPVTVTIEPARLLDTRTGLGLAGPFGHAAPRDVQIRGPVDVATATGVATRTVVPPDALGVLVNVTVVRPSDRGFLSLRPGGAVGAPTTSTVNFEAGAVAPNSAVVDLGSDGSLQVWLSLDGEAGTADVLVDVVGYTIGHDHDDRYYTEEEVDGRLAAKADAADVYAKQDVYTRDEVDQALASKADAADVYVRQQVDDALAMKADAADVYTSNETDAAIEAAIEQLFAAQFQPLVISGASFRREAPATEGQFFFEIPSGIYKTNDECHVAPVEGMPDGATIDQVTFHVFDESAVGVLLLNLRRAPLDGSGLQQVVAEGFYDGDAGSQPVTITSVAHPVVDTTYHYFANICGGAEVGTLGIHGLSIHLSPG
jgi:hypothetical protein